MKVEPEASRPSSHVSAAAIESTAAVSPCVSVSAPPVLPPTAASGCHISSRGQASGTGRREPARLWMNGTNCQGTLSCVLLIAWWRL